MNGAESLLRTLAGGGVELCFANPGTTELSLVQALDPAGIRPVLGLFEGVCTGAADGYGRMTGRAAAVLLHLGPGLANGLANLHNARRARTPVLVLVGEHATGHRPFDPPLASDIAALARPVSGWLRGATTAGRLGRDGAEALAAANAGQVATLVIPSDVQWDEADGVAEVAAPPARWEVREETLAEAAALARQPATLLLGGPALGEEGLRAAARIAAVTGWGLCAETFPARLECGGGLPAVGRLPYFPEQAVEALATAPRLVLAGARSPVAFFAYPGQPSSLVPDGVQVSVLAEADEDAAGALVRLADALGAPAAPGPHPGPQVAAAQPPSGALTPETVATALLAVQPEHAIIVDESATTGLGYTARSATARRHTQLHLTGGAIGQGPPCATGAALACPDRPVIDFQADGSAAYTLQALWTQARESLDVTTLVCANRSYRILQAELHRGGMEPGPAAAALTDLSGLDWVRLAEGQGVPGARATTAEALVTALERALAEPGPHLVEAVL